MEEKNKGGRPKMWTDEAVDKLGEELLECVRKDGVYHLVAFATEKGKVLRWLYDVKRKNERFGVYLTRAKQILGEKLFNLGLTGNPNNWILKTYMGRYLDEREYYYDDMREELLLKIETAKASMDLEPDHPFWGQLIQFIDDSGKKRAPKR